MRTFRRGLIATCLIATITLPLLHKVTSTPTLRSTRPLPRRQTCLSLLSSDLIPSFNPYEILNLHHLDVSSFTFSRQALQKARRDLWPLYPCPPAFPGDPEAYEAINHAFEFTTGETNELPGVPGRLEARQMSKREYDFRYRYAVERTLCEGWNGYVEREELRERERERMLWRGEVSMLWEATRGRDWRGFLGLVRELLGPELIWYVKILRFYKERGERFVTEGTVRYRNTEGRMTETTYPISLPPVAAHTLSPLQWYLVYTSCAARAALAVLSTLSVIRAMREIKSSEQRGSRHTALSPPPPFKTSVKARRKPGLGDTVRTSSSVGHAGCRVERYPTSCTGRIEDGCEAWDRRRRSKVGGEVREESGRVDV